MRISAKRTLAAAAVAVVGVTSLAIGDSASVSAGNEAPVVNTSNDVVLADVLPTVQIDGVVWSQTVIGNTVYAGGNFSNARPAGAAPGTNLIPRSNLLAYDIRTGQLINSSAPVLNGQVLSVSASPDGSRVYIAGEFTTVNGQSRQRVAALSASTGQLISSFNPVGVTSQSRAIVATATTVYVGGSFLGAGNVPRNNLAAFRASDGALVNWAPVADREVWALAVTDDGSTVFAGGKFENLNGEPNYGAGKLDGSSGAVLPWALTDTVRNGGADAGYTSLRVHNGFVYGTTFHFGPGGNLEGNFKAPIGSGEVEWVTNCFGDVYSNFVVGGTVYQVGHSHYCGDVGGGFPNPDPWVYQHLMAYTDTVGGEHLTNGMGRQNWAGTPSPSIVNWLPKLGIGSFTGQFQAGWSVSGNDDYVVVGGEFPSANFVAQQGLVRFARRPISPQNQGPRFDTGTFVPTLQATSESSIEVSWLAGYDPDDRELTYTVIRDGRWSTPAYQTTAESNWWTLPKLGFEDEGLTPGQNYRYQLVVRDASGNTVYGGSANLTLPTSPIPSNTYADQVRADGARLYWPLNESAGSTVLDNAGFYDGAGLSNVTFGVAGAVPGDTAVSFANSNNSRINTVGTETGEDTFTAQVWIKTTTDRGGRILGFGDNVLGNSGHR